MRTHGNGFPIRSRPSTLLERLERRRYKSRPGMMIVQLQSG